MQITEQIHALKIPFHITVSSEIRIERFVYVYFICGEKIYMIDSAVSSAKVEIINYIKSIGREVDDIETIFLTHTHPDHIGAVAAIKELSHCSVVVHGFEKEWLADVNTQFEERFVPGFHTLVGGSVMPEQLLEGNESIVLEDGLTLRVLHTPGHSRGSVSFYLEEEKVLFSGDVIPVIADIPIYEDVQALRQSIETLNRMSGVEVLCSSWAFPCKGEYVSQAFQDAMQYLDRIADAVQKNKRIVLSAPMDGCKNVLQELGLPLSAANQLVLKSFMSHLV